MLWHIAQVHNYWALRVHWIDKPVIIDKANMKFDLLVNKCVYLHLGPPPTPEYILVPGAIYLERGRSLCFASVEAPTCTGCMHAEYALCI